MAHTSQSTSAAAGQNRAWRLEVMGTPRLSGGNRSWVLERKTAGMLTYLALEGEATRSRLAGLLWSDSDESRARANLRQCLHRLKSQLGAEIVSVSEIARLEVGVAVDAVQLESGSFLGDDGLALTLEHELLEGLDFDDQPDFAEWLEITRRRFMALHREALRHDLERLELAARYDPGEVALALERAERLVARDALAEEAYRVLMRLHASRGDRALALAVYRRCEETLERELGVSPSVETKALAERLERGEEAAPRVSARLPERVLRPPRLVGRGRDLERMRSAWADGKAIVLHGVPGVGKSRLMQEFLSSLGVNHHHFEGRPGDGIAAYSTHVRTYRRMLSAFPNLQLEGWVVTELSRLLPELGGTPTPIQSESDKLRFFEAQAAATRAAVAAGMGVVSVDDLQFVDEASLEAGLYVYAQHWGQPGGMRQIIAYRTGELSGRAEDLIARAIKGGHAVELRLEPLEEDSMRDLLSSLELPVGDGTLEARLVEHAGGNPLFALETVRSLIEQDALEKPLQKLPTSDVVRRVVQERLERLPSEALKLAQVAAVAGMDFDFALAESVRGLDGFALSQAAAALEDAQVLIGHRFAHDLIFEATLHGIPHGIRVLLHGRIASHLERQKRSAARVAHHWLEAGEQIRAAPHLLSAAHNARDAYRMAEAAEFFQRAGEIYARAGQPEDASEAFYAAAGQLVAFDAGQGLEALIERMFALAQSPRSRGRAWLAKLLNLNTMQHAGEAETAARAALEHLGVTSAAPDEEATADPLHAVALSGLAEALWRAGRHAEAAGVIARAIALYERLNDPQGRADSEARLGIIHGDSEQHDLAKTHLERSISLSAALGNEFSVAKSRNMLGITLGRMGLVRDAQHQHREVEAICARIHGAEILMRMNLSNLAQRCFDLDQYDEALRRSAWSLELTKRDFGWARAYAQTHQARVHLRLGDLEGTRELLLRIEETPELRDDMRFDALLLRGRLEAQLGHAGSARAALLEAKSLGGVGRPFSRIELGIALAASAEPDEREEIAAEALRLAVRHGLNGLVIGAATRLAQAFLETSDLRAARQSIARATDLLERFDPNNFYRAEVWWTEQRVLKAANDPTANEQLSRAVAWVFETTDQGVPDQHRESFLTRNPVNHAILSAAKDAGLELAPTQSGPVTLQ